MKCFKCGIDLPEKDIQLSHDIPKYMGGLDSDGRHWLCQKCHDNYEYEILKIVLMDFIKNSSNEFKTKCRQKAKLVSSYFFKNAEGNHE